MMYVNWRNSELPMELTFTLSSGLWSPMVSYNPSDPDMSLDDLSVQGWDAHH